MALTDITKKAWTAVKRAASIGLACTMLYPAPTPNKGTGQEYQEAEPQTSQKETKSNKRMLIPVYYQTEYVYVEVNGKQDLVKEISRDPEKAFWMEGDRIHVVRATKNTKVDYWKKNEAWKNMNAEQIEEVSNAIIKVLNGHRFDPKKIKPEDLVYFYDTDGNDIIHADNYFLNESPIQTIPMVREIKSKEEKNIAYSDHEKLVDNLINKYGKIYFINGDKEILIREQEAIKLSPEHAWIRISELRQRELNER